MQIAVVDLGVGNLRSVEQALNVVAPDARVLVSSDPQLIADSDKVVLPGQGAVGTWFNALSERTLEEAVRNAIETKPLLGICVGMQALFEYCEEDGGIDGLGLFQGSVRHFSNFHAPQTPALKIPQMGWNQVVQTRPHPLWHGIQDQSHFYFVHSFCANGPESESLDVVGETDYGHTFIAAIARDNVFAVQFHPEKSHNDGLALLKNFTEWNGQA